MNLFMPLLLARYIELETLRMQISGYGDGSDGEFYSTGNVTFNIETEDYDTVVKQYSSFTLNAGHTLTVNKRCRGLIILCHGDVVINGTINMNYKGALADPNGTEPHTLEIPLGTMVLSIGPGGNGGNGGNGGDGGRDEEDTTGDVGHPGGNGASGLPGTWYGGGFGGAGGGGAAGWPVTSAPSYTDPGGNAGSSSFDIAPNESLSGGDNRGGNGDYWCGGGGGGGRREAGVGGGGAGLDGGSAGAPGYSYTEAQSGGSGWLGAGGMVLIVSKGNITIGSTGEILANGGGGASGGYGGDGNDSENPTSGGGGGGGGGGQGGFGGGIIVIAYKGSYSNNGTLQANGGSGGSGGSRGLGGNDESENGVNGGNGGAGKISAIQL